MNSKSITSISKVKTTVLKIQESNNGVRLAEESAVNVTLKKGKLIGKIEGTEVFKGKMKYKDGKKEHTIDMVQAVFSNPETSIADGNAMLKISLTKNNKFVGPLVTTAPNDPSATPLHCIQIEACAKDLSTIIVTFEEPKQGEFIAYPSIYFHTAQGVIDPGMGVIRKPD